MTMADAVRSLTVGTIVEGRADLLERAANMFDAARKVFGEQWLVLRDMARAASAEAKMSIEIQARRMRSEEHTSELQSLMRISYAVFCLKKKTQQIHINN